MIGGTWKQVESKVTREEIIGLFSFFEIIPPEPMIQYFLADRHLNNQVKFRQYGAMVEPIPSDNPLGPIRGYLNSWKPLIELGYIPISELGDGFGPICLNTKTRKVVWFDHEQIFLLPDRPSENRLADLEQHLCNDLDSFYTELLAAPI